MDSELKGGGTRSNPIPHEEIIKLPDLNGLSAKAACDAFLKSEDFYVERGLRIVAEQFHGRLVNMNKLERGILTQDELNSVFLNVKNIYDFHISLKKDLWDFRLKDGGVQGLVNSLGILMTRFIPFFKLYTQYIKNYRRSLAQVEELKKKKSAFAKFLTLNEMCAEHSLAGLLMIPVTRLPQYLIFLGAIYQGLEAHTQAAEQLQSAIRAIQSVTDEIAFSLRDQVARKLVVTVQQKVFGGKVDLVSPHRYVVKHGNLRMVYPKSMFTKRFRNYIFILFNDCILYGTRPGSLFSGSPKRVHRLKGVMVQEVPDDTDYKFAFRIFTDPKAKDMTGKFDILVHAFSLKEKEKWVHDIQQEIYTNAQSVASLEKTGLDVTNEEFENIVLLKKKAKEIPGGSASQPAPPSISNLPTSSSYSTLPSLPPPTPSTSDRVHERPSLARAGSFPSASPPPAPPQHTPTNELWAKKWDPQYSEWYWEHKETGESQWEKPDGWTEEAPKPPAPAPAPTPTPLRTVSRINHQPALPPSSSSVPPPPATPSTFRPSTTSNHIPIPKTPQRRASTTALPDSAKKQFVVNSRNSFLAKQQQQKQQQDSHPLPPPTSHPPPSPVPSTPAQRKSSSFFTHKQPSNPLPNHLAPTPPGPPRGPPPPGPPPSTPSVLSNGSRPMSRESSQLNPPPPPPPDSPSQSPAPERGGLLRTHGIGNPPPPPDLDYPDPASPTSPSTGSSPDIDESPPDAPPMEAPPMDAPTLEAPPLIFPTGPARGKQGTEHSVPPSPGPSSSSSDLLSSIRSADKTSLRKTTVVPTSSGGRKASTDGSPAPGAAGLGDALKQSLDRYRQFVQDEEDDIDAVGGGGGGEDDEWDP